MNINKNHGLLLVSTLLCLSPSVFASGKEKASLQNAEKIERGFKLSEKERTDIQKELHSPSAKLKHFLKASALKNPGVKSAFYTWKSDLFKVPQARVLMDPKFDYMYYIQEVETRVGPQKHKFGITQAFPWFGTLALKGGVAWEKAEQSRLQFEAKKLELFFQVKDAYYDYYYLGRALAIHRENFALLKQWEGVLLKKYSTGSALYGQVIKIQVEIGKLEDGIKTLESKRIPIDTRLKSLINISDTALFAYPQKAMIDSVHIDQADLFEKILKNNPDLAYLERKIEMNEKKIDLARKKYYPGFMVGVNYIQTGGSRMTPVPTDDGKDPLMVGASINIPIQVGRTSLSVKEAEAGKKSAEQAKKNLESMFRTRLARLIFEIDDAKRKAFLYKGSLMPKAIQALEAFDVSFRGGKAGYLDLLDAQRVLLQFELAYEKAVSDHEKGLAELEMIIGEDL